MVRPGRLAQDYFEGRADKDIPPWSLFTLTAAAAAVMTGGFSLDGSILQYLTVDVWFSADDFQARAPVFGTDAVTWLLLLIAVPVYTACLRALFPTRRTGEHFVVALHVLSFAMLCLIGDAVLLRLAAPLGATRAATLASALLVPAAFVAYLYATLRRLHPSYDVIDVGWRLVALVVLHGAAAAAAGRLLSRLHGMLAG